MKYASIKTTWQNLGTLAYQRRLGAYLDCSNAGMDDEAAVAHVQQLFADLESNPLDHAALARDRAAARKLEDGE